MTQFNVLNYFGSDNKIWWQYKSKKIVVRTIHHVKTISIKPFFLCSPITLFLLVLSSNLINKRLDNNPSISSQGTYSCKRMNVSITNSGIRSLKPLNAMLTTLSHKNWLCTVPVLTRWSENRSIYCRGLAYFAMET